MKIHNVRLGLATNSSSTHSIIFAEKVLEDEGCPDFGWNHFVASSKESKTQYLLHVLYNNLISQVSVDIATAVCKDWLGGSVGENNGDGFEGYVDHQSVHCLPKEYSGKGVSKAFFAEYRDFLLTEGIAILGGNDNSDDSHPDSDAGARINLPIPKDDTSSNSLVCRRDDAGYWVLFDRVEGTKVRFSFDALDDTPVRSYNPELVDLKITDFCSKAGEALVELDYKEKPKLINGKTIPILNANKQQVYGVGGGGECAYCYQGSSPQGKHATMESIHRALYRFHVAEVLEIAIGGGEPTQHPKFADIISTAKSYGITPNFTTKSLEWFKQPWAQQVLADAGGFAYSVTTAKQVGKFAHILNEVGYEKRAYVHYVLGTSTQAEFLKILQAASKNGIQVTLLGYKLTGRGCEFEPMEHSDWLKTIKTFRESNGWMRIGVDTAIVDQFGRTIELEGISKTLYHVEEGKFSCYVDAVTGQISPSSYAERTAYTPFGDDWLERYRTY